MNESTWTSCQLLYELLALARERMTDRQRRLFAVGCCLRARGEMVDERSRRALDIAIAFADGRVDDHERQSAQEDASDAYIDLRDSRLSLDSSIVWTRQAELLAQAAALTVAAGKYYSEDAADCVRWALLAARGWRSEQEEELAQCDLLREIVGPVFRTPVIEPTWRVANDSAATNLAALIDREQSFETLPILADALEDAGCFDERILAHCRDGGEHVRGCWVVELVLGKS